MLLPMMGFFMMLIVFGGIGSLVTAFDPYAAHRAPVPYAILFAGLGFYLIFFVAFLVEVYVNVSVAGVIGFSAPLVGGVGGGIFGYCLGLTRRRSNAEIQRSVAAEGDKQTSSRY